MYHGVQFDQSKAIYNLLKAAIYRKSLLYDQYLQQNFCSRNACSFQNNNASELQPKRKYHLYLWSLSVLYLSRRRSPCLSSNILFSSLYFLYLEVFRSSYSSEEDLRRRSNIFITHINAEAYSGLIQTTKMEIFAITFTGLQLTTIFAKIFVLDVSLGSE